MKMYNVENKLVRGFEFARSITNIIIIIFEFAVLFLISWLISKKTKKNFYKVVVIIWSIIFLINLIAVIFNIPFILGINISPYFDGGTKRGTYLSLGYVIVVEGKSINKIENLHFIEEIIYDIHFNSIFEIYKY